MDSEMDKYMAVSSEMAKDMETNLDLEARVLAYQHDNK